MQSRVNYCVYPSKNGEEKTWNSNSDCGSTRTKLLILVITKTWKMSLDRLFNQILLSFFCCYYICPKQVKMDWVVYIFFYISITRETGNLSCGRKAAKHFNQIKKVGSIKKDEVKVCKNTK